MSTFKDIYITKGTRAHTHRELIREWLWEPKGSSLEYIQISIYLSIPIHWVNPSPPPHLLRSTPSLQPSQQTSYKHILIYIYISIYLSIPILWVNPERDIPPPLPLLSPAMPRARTAVRSAIIKRAPYALSPPGAAWLATTPRCCIAHSAPCPRPFILSSQVNSLSTAPVDRSHINRSTSISISPSIPTYIYTKL